MPHQAAKPPSPLDFLLTMTCTNMLYLVVATTLVSLFHAVDASTPGYWPYYGGDHTVELLDGVWNMSQLGSIDHPPQDFDSMDPFFDPSSVATPNLKSVPSCVDNTPPGYLGYRGVTFFRRLFQHDLSNTGARLQFQACSFYCRVWINGKEIGDHRAGGYVAFTLDVPPQDTTQNEIFVLVDNRFNDTTAPVHNGGDFWHYGGIMRSVELHSLPQPGTIWPWRLYVLPVSLSTVDLTLHLVSNYSGKIANLEIAFHGGTVHVFSGKAVNGVVKLGTLGVPNPRVWSTTNPHLHTVIVQLNGASVKERFGLRIFGTDNTSHRLTLNGQVLKLVGWNHHTQWPETAASPTDEQLDADMALLIEGGANFVRGAHYPQDPRWLDRLDEAGMVVWSETLGPNVSVKNSLDPIFLKYQAQQMNEMLDNAMNHASIGMWGFFNEGPSDMPEACPAYQASADIIYSRDHTRFVTYASSKNLRDKCFETVTLVSINAYPGWYEREEPQHLWNRFANSVHAGSPAGTLGKPFIISETGAGGIFEWSSNKTAARWTLAYQSQIINIDVDTAISNVNVSGISLWHFFDFKTDDKTENNTHCEYLPDIYPPICGYINVTSNTFSRPGGLNHKGVIDFWRRKKPIYFEVAAKYNSTKSKAGVPELTETRLHRSAVD